MTYKVKDNMHLFKNGMKIKVVSCCYFIGGELDGNRAGIIQYIKSVGFMGILTDNLLELSGNNEVEILTDEYGRPWKDPQESKKMTMKEAIESGKLAVGKKVIIHWNTEPPEKLEITHVDDMSFRTSDGMMWHKLDSQKIEFLDEPAEEVKKPEQYPFGLEIGDWVDCSDSKDTHVKGIFKGDMNNESWFLKGELWAIDRDDNNKSGWPDKFWRMKKDSFQAHEIRKQGGLSTYYPNITHLKEIVTSSHHGMKTTGFSSSGTLTLENLQKAVNKLSREKREMFPYIANHLELFKTNEPKAQKKTIMSNIVDKLKNLTLSAEDRVLRKHGFEDENGKKTNTAYDMMDDELNDERWAKRRLEIAADLIKLDAEEKK